MVTSAIKATVNFVFQIVSDMMDHLEEDLLLLVKSSLWFVLSDFWETPGKIELLVGGVRSQSRFNCLTN
jgi:hypothetical protein